MMRKESKNRMDEAKKKRTSLAHSAAKALLNQKKRISQRIRIGTRRTSGSFDSVSELNEGFSRASFDDVFGPAKVPPRDRFEFSNPRPVRTKRLSSVTKAMAEGDKPGPKSTTGFLRDLEYGTYVSYDDYDSGEEQEEENANKGSDEQDDPHANSLLETARLYSRNTELAGNGKPIGSVRNAGSKTKARK